MMGLSAARVWGQFPVEIPVEIDEICGNGWKSEQLATGSWQLADVDGFKLSQEWCNFTVSYDFFFGF
jgi:hypothetical protein